MQDNQGNHLGSINVKQSWELIFNFAILSRDTSALFVECVPLKTTPVLSLKSRLLMAMLCHNFETSRFVSEVCLSSQILSDEGLDDLRTAWKATSKLELTIGYADAFSSMLKDIAARPSQDELILDGDVWKLPPFAQECDKDDAPFLPSSQECNCRSCQLSNALGVQS